MLGIEIVDVNHHLTYSIGRPLEPVLVFKRLLRRQDFNKAIREAAETVGLGDVTVE